MDTSLPTDLPPDPFAVTTLDQLRQIYDQPRDMVLAKVTQRITAATRGFIAAAPFCLLSTTGPGGVHCTPRGDAPGFVEVVDDTTLLLPDRRGNNRLDALQDILADPRVSLLFLVPGVTETLRVHGLAQITADPTLCARFVVNGKTPATVLRIRVTELYMQCAKALMRSKLWADRTRPREVPTMGALLAEHTRGQVTPADYDAAAPARIAETIY
jgi:PPOX class probable FMN-dependent enzyme